MDNLVGVVRAIYKRRKAIILLSFLTAVLTAGFSLLLPNWYEGNTLFYVASPDLAKPSPIGLSESKIEYYGEGEDIDRILTIAESSQLANYLVQHFDLMGHYKIDPENKKAQYKVLKEFSKHYNIVKTKYEALSMSFECVNPILSRDVTNVARDKVNEIAQQLIKDSQKKMLLTYEQNISSKQSRLDTLQTETDSLRNKYGIYDTKTQGQVIAELITTTSANLQKTRSKKDIYAKLGGRYRDSVQVLNAASQAYTGQLENLKEQAKNFNKGISVVSALEQQQEEASAQLALDSERYKSLKSKYNTDFDAVHVVEFASEPVVKNRPRRSMLVIGAGIFSFFILCLGAILIEFYNKINWKSILNE
ncbi:hypothetical protein N9231_05535 [Saprospiraceae bacterium]|nr:hypothetical protein [Saprospiraceae bacterium]